MQSRMHTSTRFFLLCTQIIAHIITEENINTENNKHVTNNKSKQWLKQEKHVDAMLSDKELKKLLIQKLVDGSHMAKGTTPK